MSEMSSILCIPLYREIASRHEPKGQRGTAAQDAIIPKSRSPCVPSMITDSEVKVLWGVGRDDPSEPQGEDREKVAESSGKRDLRGDGQKPDTRRDRSGRAAKEPRSSCDQRAAP